MLPVLTRRLWECDDVSTLVTVFALHCQRADATVHFFALRCQLLSPALVLRMGRAAGVQHAI